MPVVVAVWPNNTISIIRMRSGYTPVELFDQIDQEADPCLAKCYELRIDKEGCYATVTPGEPKHETNMGSGVTMSVEMLCGRKKRVVWPVNIARTWQRMISRDFRKSQREVLVKTVSSEELQNFPAEPTETFTVEEVRGMDQFCGVYFAYNDDGSCHYVGESLNVPKRVSSSRQEIGARRIGVIRCGSHDRKRIESYFVAILDPPGNAISTHSMRIKESPDGR